MLCVVCRLFFIHIYTSRSTSVGLSSESSSSNRNHVPIPSLTGVRWEGKTTGHCRGRCPVSVFRAMVSVGGMLSWWETSAQASLDEPCARMNKSPCTDVRTWYMWATWRVWFRKEGRRGMVSQMRARCKREQTPKMLYVLSFEF